MKGKPRQGSGNDGWMYYKQTTGAYASSSFWNRAMEVIWHYSLGNGEPALHQRMSKSKRDVLYEQTLISQKKKPPKESFVCNGKFPSTPYYVFIHDSSTQIYKKK